MTTHLLLHVQNTTNKAKYKFKHSTILIHYSITTNKNTCKILCRDGLIFRQGYSWNSNFGNSLNFRCNKKQFQNKQYYSLALLWTLTLGIYFIKLGQAHGLSTSVLITSDLCFWLNVRQIICYCTVELEKGIFWYENTENKDVYRSWLWQWNSSMMLQIKNNDDNNNTGNSKADDDND